MAIGHSRIVHATTTATNALLQKRIPKIGLITNRGFRDVLEIRRHARPDVYNHRLEMSVPLVPRDLRLEVTGRLDHRGEILEPLDMADVATAVATLRREEVVSVAVCFLHAYAHPDE